MPQPRAPQRLKYDARKYAKCNIKHGSSSSESSEEEEEEEEEDSSDNEQIPLKTQKGTKTVLFVTSYSKHKEIFPTITTLFS